MRMMIWSPPLRKTRNSQSETCWERLPPRNLLPPHPRQLRSWKRLNPWTKALRFTFAWKLTPKPEVRSLISAPHRSNNSGISTHQERSLSRLLFTVSDVWWDMMSRWIRSGEPTCQFVVVVFVVVFVDKTIVSLFFFVLVLVPVVVVVVVIMVVAVFVFGFSFVQLPVVVDHTVFESVVSWYCYRLCITHHLPHPGLFEPSWDPHPQRVSSRPFGRGRRRRRQRPHLTENRRRRLQGILAPFSLVLLTICLLPF